MFACDEHNEMCSNLHIFKHLRKLHGAGKGGKSMIRERALDWRPISIQMTSGQIRSLFILELNNTLSKIVHRLKLTDFNNAQLAQLVLVDVTSARSMLQVVRFVDIVMLNIPNENQP